MSKFENGNTFCDEDKNNSLIGGFGDVLGLHSINPGRTVFINHFKLSGMHSHMKHSQKRKICKRTYDYSLHVISDPFIPRIFGYQKILTFYLIEQFKLRVSKCLEILPV